MPPPYPRIPKDNRLTLLLTSMTIYGSHYIPAKFLKKSSSNIKKHPGGLVFRPGTTLLAVAGLLAKSGMEEAHRSMQAMGLVLTLLDEIDLTALTLLLWPLSVLILCP